MKKIRTACPRDCQDCCSLLALVDESGRLVEVQGDSDHPVTRGFLCSKGLSYPELVYHPQRLRYPLLKKRGDWQKIHWLEAIDFMQSKLESTLENYGPEAILHFHYSGSESLTKKITKRFFSLLGSTGVHGDLCMSGGVAAQIYDFGGLEQSPPQDLIKANGCVIWGRNIAATNQHLLPFLKKAYSNGTQILIINPLTTSLEEMAVGVIRPRPGTDAALALGACHYLIKTGRIDRDFIAHHTYGYREFTAHIEDMPPAKAALITGLEEGEIIEVADFFAGREPVTTLLGYGLQRYRGGGNIIRAIDALSALTGNIGKPGAVVSYCSDTCWGLNERIQGPAKNSRFFALTNLAEEILTADPPIELAFINAANPVVNAPDAARMKRALASIETVVVMDMFMTDTARTADLVLPCTTFFEEEGVRVSSWSSWVFYCPQVIEPVGEARPDEDVMLALAGALDIPGMAWRDRKELLQWALEPLGISYSDIKEGHFCNPQAPDIAWGDRQFRTASGKFEFYSKKALAEGQSPMAVFIPPRTDGYPLNFISPHSKHRIHSQFQPSPRIMKVNPKPRAYLHPATANEFGIKEGDRIEIFNDRGTLKVAAGLSARMCPDVVALDSGWEHASGGCANMLVAPGSTEMGDCASLYDTRVGIRKVE